MMIDTRDFKSWLLEQDVNGHVAKDYASRVAKAEKGLMKSGQCLSFFDEYREDNGKSVMNLFSKMGKNIDKKSRTTYWENNNT